MNTLPRIFIFSIKTAVASPNIPQHNARDQIEEERLVHRAPCQET